MEPGVVQQVTIAGLLEVPVDLPTLDKALERYACPISYMRISPAEPVSLVKIDGKVWIVRTVALNGHRPEKRSLEVMRRAVARVLRINVQQLHQECEDWEALRKKRRLGRENRMA